MLQHLGQVRLSISTFHYAHITIADGLLDNCDIVGASEHKFAHSSDHLGQLLLAFVGLTRKVYCDLFKILRESFAVF